MKPEAVIDIVGSSQHWYDYEEEHGICHDCSGDGEFSSTGYEDGVKTECKHCKGTGIQLPVLIAAPFEPTFVDPEVCPFRPWHSYVPSFEEPTTWSCVACNKPGDLNQYEHYDLEFQKERLCEYLWDCVIPSDEDERSDFLSEVLSLLSLEQLKDIVDTYSDTEHWWDY